MALKATCPRCKEKVTLPDDKAGSYAICGQCRGRFWIPQRGDATASRIAVPTQPVPPPPPPPGADVATTPPGGTAPPPAASTPAVAQGPPAPPPPPPGKVARFITANKASSTLQASEDGKLPELQLRSGKEKKKREIGANAVNPLVLPAVLSLSVLLSVFLVLYEPTPPASSRNSAQAEAREKLRDFFVNLDPEQPLEPYQVRLREARRAHSQGDRAAERKLYRSVLDELRAERGPFDRGLTGSRGRDKELEDLISILLSEERRP